MMDKMAELIGEIKEKLAELEMMAMNKEMPEYEASEEEIAPEMDMKKAAFVAKMKKDMMG
jgi:hypothetical protein